MIILLPRLRDAGSTSVSQLLAGKVCQEMMKLLSMLGPEAKDPQTSHWDWWISFGVFRGHYSGGEVAVKIPRPEEYEGSRHIVFGVVDR